MKFRYFLLAFLFFYSNSNFIIAQTKPKQKKSTKETTTIIESDVVSEEPEPPTESSRFSREKICDDWSFVRDRLSNDYNVGIEKNGTIVLPMIFRSRSNNSSYCETKKIILFIENNFGVFDLNKGKWHIPLSYQDLSILDNNLMIARKGDKYGIIDFENKPIVNFEWKSINPISQSNYVIVQNDQKQYGILNLVTLKLTTPCNYKQLSRIDNTTNFMVTNFAGQKSFISFNNEPLLKNWYDEIHTVYSKRNLIVKKNGKYGIIDDRETVILPLEYNMIKTYPYNDGSYLAQNDKGKYGCVSIDGRITLPFEYDQMNESSGQSILISSKDNKCGIVQVNQGLPNEILTCDYDDIQVNKQAFIVSKSKKFGLLDNYGKLILPIEYDDLFVVNDKEYGQNNLFIAKKDGRYLVLNNSGQKVNNKTYNYISTLKMDRNYDNYYNKIYGIKYVSDNNKVGILDLFGGELIEAKYDDIEFINNSFIVFKQGNYYGMYNYINKKEIASPIYDQIINTKKGYIGIKGLEMFNLDLNNNTNHQKIR